MNHRCGNRIALDLPVLVMNPVTSHCGTGRLVNISLNGALITGSPDSHVGARIQVSIGVASGMTSSTSVIDAYLVRKAGPAFAIQWAQFAPAEIVALVKEPRHPPAV
jgi:hypothetical protein